MSIMFPKPHHPQRGFAIVSAIFIVVALAALGGYIATVSTAQHIGSALDTIGAKAYQAARSGTEWGLSRAILGGQPSTNCGTDASGATTNIASVNGMAVTVNCAIIAPSSSELGMGTIYRITATACNAPSSGSCPGDAGSADYVERRLTVVADTTLQE